MNVTQQVVRRLTSADPGWDEWNELIALVELLSFEIINDEYLGTFYVSDGLLVFADSKQNREWPEWLPKYVPALFGLKADAWEMAGGYADAFNNELAVKGALFSPAGNDADLGYPLFDVPPGVYTFQSNSSGALFFITEDLEVLYPNSRDQRFDRLDSLEQFTKTNITQALAGETWFRAYKNVRGSLLD